MSNKKTRNELLIDRLSRLIGQLESIKKNLSEPDVDCVKISRTIKASSRSFSSLRKAFIECFLEEKYLSKKTVQLKKDETYQSLLEIISI